jgi:hypothetical protein
MSPSFRRFLEDVRRDFMQRVHVVFHGTLGLYLRDALHEAGGAAVVCLFAPRAEAYVPSVFCLLPFVFSSSLVDSATFFVIKIVPEKAPS